MVWYKFLDVFKRPKIEETSDEKERKRRDNFRVNRYRFREGIDSVKRADYMNDPLVMPILPTKAYTLGEAHMNMEQAKKNGNLMAALCAYDGYRQLGKADKPYVVDGLLKAYGVALKNAQKNDLEIPSFERKSVQRILAKHSRGVTIQSPLENTAAMASVMGLFGGIFFLSANITGNVIGNLTITNSTWFGAVLFCVGLVGCLFWVKNNKKK